MEEYQKRVIDEQIELNLKIPKLEEFIETSTFLNLSSFEKFLLSMQLYHMQQYNRILDARIILFNGGEPTDFLKKINLYKQKTFTENPCMEIDI